MEVEQKNQSPFPDVLVCRNDDIILGHQVYTKPTHTARYFRATSQYHSLQKNSVISSLVYRTLTISEGTTLNAEVKHLKQALTKNRFNIKNINHTTEIVKQNF